VQADFTKITAARKEVLLTIEAERVQNGYNKYVAKSARDISVPGFRPGKAPLSMVERMYGDKIREYFYKDFVDEIFPEASKQFEINYLLFPEIKEINWEPGQDMTIKVEIEVEPEVFFKQVEGLKVPYKPLELKDEVEHYIEELRKENSTLIDVDKDIAENDEIEFEVRCNLDGKEFTRNHTTHANKEHEPQITEAALGRKIGDTFILTLPHAYIHHIFKDAEHSHHDGDVEASFMVNAIRRTKLPEIDDEFAKDLEFDNVKEMKKKITEELKEKNVLKNQNIRINALITKLYVDNRFDLPEKTIQYLAEKELDQYKITDAQWRKYYEFQIRYQITQDFINMYLMKALRKQYQMEPAEDDITKYIEHEAKLSDQSVDDWKEKNKKIMEGEDFKETVGNYMILNKIAETCDYFVAEEEPIVSDIPSAEGKEKKKTAKKTKEKSEEKSEV
jgi:trigger factor